MSGVNWRNFIEQNTGEVSGITLAACLGISENRVRNYANQHHGCRFVGGTSGFLIWKEDAVEIENILIESQWKGLV